MSDAKVGVPWYELDDSTEVATAVMDGMDTLRTRNESRYERWDMNEALMHEGRPMDDTAVGRTASVAPWRPMLTMSDGKLRYNIIRPIVDALLARLGTSRPKARCQTAGARWTDRRRARALTKWVKGTWAATSVYTEAQQVFRDCNTYGIGYMKPYVVDGRVYVERVHPRSVFIEEPDYGRPRSWMQAELVSAARLRDMYPEAAKLIDAAPKQNDEDTLVRHFGYDREQLLDADLVLVVEAWYAPLGGQGKHVLAMEGGLLVNEEWTSGFPGLVAFRMFEPAFRYVGLSTVDLLKEIQREVNYLLRKVQEHMNLGGTVKIFVDSASKVAVEKLNNENLQIIKYTSVGGAPVQVVQIPAVDRVYFEQIDRLEQKAYNLAGISELFAAAQKPAGLESGKALAQFEDIQSARFLHIGQKWQQFFIDLAQACCDTAESAGIQAQVGENYKLRGRDFRTRSNANMAWQPVNQLPDTPAGIIQAVSDYAQTDPSMAADMVMLVDDLDLEQYLERMLAPKMLVQRYVDEMLYDHTPRKPDETMDLQYALREATLAVNQARVDDDEAAAVVLMQFVADAAELIAPPAMPQEAMGMGMGPPPPEAGGMPMGAGEIGLEPQLGEQTVAPAVM